MPNVPVTERQNKATVRINAADLIAKLFKVGFIEGGQTGLHLDVAASTVTAKVRAEMERCHSVKSHFLRSISELSTTGGTLECHRRYPGVPPAVPRVLILTSFFTFLSSKSHTLKGSKVTRLAWFPRCSKVIRPSSTNSFAARILDVFGI
jgi:hypothetical protein